MPSGVRALVDAWCDQLATRECRKAVHILADRIDALVRAECQKAQPRMTDGEIGDFAREVGNGFINEFSGQHAFLLTVNMLKKVRDFYEKGEGK
jgi:hypothetical protein